MSNLTGLSDILREAMNDRPQFNETLVITWRELCAKAQNKGYLRLTKKEKEAILYQEEQLKYYDHIQDLWYKWLINHLSERL